MTPHPLVTTATLMEAAPLLKEVSILSQAVTAQGRRVIRAKTDQSFFTLIITGPGMVNTAQALTGFLEHERPSLVLQTGIAGVFPQSGLGVGDLAVAQSEKYLHTGIDTGDPEPAPLPFNLLEKDPKTRSGLFTLDQKLADQTKHLIKKSLAGESLKVTAGPFITVSAITGNQETAGRIFNLFHPVMEAMEGAAAAQVCRLYGTSFVEIRGGSNQVGERDKNFWNIPLALNRLTKAVVSILQKQQF